jgi:hypothetical protein
VVFVVAACLLGVAAGTLEARAASTDNSTLTITYVTPTSLQVTLGDGTVVTTGSVIPAGTYMVHVIDDPVTGDLNPNIRINGPGVSLVNNLNTGMGIVDPSSFGPFTFQTSSSYSIQDSIIGAATLVTFTTTATGTAGGATPAGTSSGAAGSSSGSSSAGGSSSSGARGAAVQRTFTGKVTRVSLSGRFFVLGTTPYYVSKATTYHLITGGLAGIKTGNTYKVTTASTGGKLVVASVTRK